MLYALIIDPDDKAKSDLQCICGVCGKRSPRLGKISFTEAQEQVATAGWSSREKQRKSDRRRKRQTIETEFLCDLCTKHAAKNA